MMDPPSLPVMIATGPDGEDVAGGEGGGENDNNNGDDNDNKIYDNQSERE